MPYFALCYDAVNDFINRRIPFRAEHLALANQYKERGELVLAGALGTPPDGALLVFRAANATVAEDFARQDPYVANGLVTKWQVRSWTVVIGGQE